MEKSYVSAMKEFFGLKEGQKLAEFAGELKALPEADREWFRQELIKSGVNVKPLGAL